MLEIVPYASVDWAGMEAAHDAARLQELTYAGLKAAFLPLAIAAQRENLFDYTLNVARLDGKTVGFVAFTEDELAWLYVNPKYQRQGIGRALAEHALAQMEPGEQTVEVLMGNIPAKSLYQKLGFTRENVVRGKMPGNEEFAVTVWELTRQG
jgi:ribosomal protein S18 acetylase RimI-like enzyme